jgi:hypothetical protein
MKSTKSVICSDEGSICLLYKVLWNYTVHVKSVRLATVIKHCFICLFRIILFKFLFEWIIYNESLIQSIFLCLSPIFHFRILRITF